MGHKATQRHAKPLRAGLCPTGGEAWVVELRRRWSLGGGAWVVGRGLWSVERGAWTGRQATLARRIWEAAQRRAAPGSAMDQGASRHVKASQGQPRAAGGSRNGRGVEPSPPGSRAPTATCATTADESRGETDPSHAPQRPKRRGQAGEGEWRRTQPEPQARLGKGKRGGSAGPPLRSGSRRASCLVRKRAGREAVGRRRRAECGAVRERAGS